MAGNVIAETVLLGIEKVKLPGATEEEANLPVSKLGIPVL
jgi:hypothetical protein